MGDSLSGFENEIQIDLESDMGYLFKINGLHRF
jgi:hypothetical protein